MRSGRYERVDCISKKDNTINDMEKNLCSLKAEFCH